MITNTNPVRGWRPWIRTRSLEQVVPRGEVEREQVIYGACLERQPPNILKAHGRPKLINGNFYGIQSYRLKTP